MGMDVPFLLVLLVSSVWSCELGEFECKFGKCIPKDQLCDGINHCLVQTGEVQAEDEKNCDFIYNCEVEDFSCMVDNTTRQCFGASDQVCTSSQITADPACTDFTDVLGCRCNENSNEAQFRCIADGLCYDENGFCNDCVDPLICKDTGNGTVGPYATRERLSAEKVTECEDSLDHFLCYSRKDNANRCFPNMARCDSHSSCWPSETDYACHEPVATLLSGPHAEYYIGDDITVSYRVTGEPRPNFEVYHWGKPMTLPMDDDGTTISATYTPDDPNVDYATNMDYGNMTLQLTFSNLSHLFYGPFEVVLTNHIETEGSDGSYYRRVHADGFSLDFASGVPTLDLSLNDASVDTDQSVTVNPGDDFSLTCLATGFPEPDITITLDGDAIQSDSHFTLTPEAFNSSTHTKAITLTLADKLTAIMQGVYGCQVSNVLKSLEQEYTVTVKVFKTPEILEFIGLETGYLYVKQDESFDLVCTVTGIPDISMELQKDGIKETKTQTYTDTPDNTIRQISTSYVADKETNYTCIASSDDVADTDEATTTVYPVVRPTIEMSPPLGEIKEGDAITKDVSVTFSIPVGTIHTITAGIVNLDDSPLDPSLWTTPFEVKDDDKTWTFKLQSNSSASFLHIGSYKVFANDSFFEEEAMIDIDVTVPTKFTSELEPEVENIINTVLEISVSVEGNPAPEPAVWAVNDTIIDTTSDRISTSNSSDGYFTTFTLKINGTLEEDGGIYTVTVIQASTQLNITSTSNVTVLAHPCVIGDGPCQNGGECYILPRNEYQCVCQENFNGTDCEINLWCETEISLCENNSTCETQSWPTNYTCDCLYSFRGYNCDDQVQYCVEQGNTNCGVTLDDLDTMAWCLDTFLPPKGYHCFCRHDAGGEFCNDTQLCTPNPCENDGGCLVTGYGGEAQRECQCDPGYQGELCQTKTPGHCWTDCNDRATCHEETTCLCNYPYVGESCDDEIADYAEQMSLSKRGYLTAFESFYEDEDKQSFTLSLVLPANASGIVASVVSLNETLTLSASGDLVLEVVTDTDSFTASLSIAKDTPLTVSVTTVYDMLVLEVTDVESPTTQTKGLKIDSQFGAFTSLSLGSANILAEVAGGVDMVLTAPVKIGNSVVFHYNGWSSGASVGEMDVCAYSLCLNGGVCMSDGSNRTSTCNCPDGFTGDLCEIEVTTCDKGCMNGGECVEEFCVCSFMHHGVLCEQQYDLSSVSGWVLAGEASHVTYPLSTDLPLSLALTWTAESNGALDWEEGAPLVTVGDGAHSVEVRGAGTTLYLVVTRGAGVVAVPIDTASYNHQSAFDTDSVVQMNMEITEESISVSNGNSTFVLDELPSSTGLSGLHSLTVHALPGFSATSSVSVGGSTVEAVTAVGGVSVRDSSVVDPCAGQCGAATCTVQGNSISCSGCPNGTNPVTCSDITCGNCSGSCTDIGECVCSHGNSGASCDQVIEFADLVMPKTVSSHFSYLHYQVEAIEGSTAQVEFTLNLAPGPQYGLLMFAGNDDQFIMMTLHNDTIWAGIHCSDISYTELMVHEVPYGVDITIGISQTDSFASLTVNSDPAMSNQVEVEPCYFMIGEDLYLGGTPWPMVNSVKATFAPTNSMMPLGGQLVDSAAVEDSLTDLCDTEYSPCSSSGTDSCVLSGVEYTCTCHSGYIGDSCETVLSLCDMTVCSEGEICIEQTGVASCLCDFPTTRNSEGSCAGDVSEELEGICFEEQGMATVDLAQYVSEIANNFDLYVRFMTPSGNVSEGDYDLARLTFHTETGYASLGLRVNVATTTELVNGTMVNGTMVDCTMVNGTMIDGDLVNCTMVNGTMVNGTMVNGTMVDCTMVNGTMVNGTMVDCTMVNGTMVDETEVVTTLHTLIVPDLMEESLELIIGDWNILRVTASGAGTTLELNGEVFSSDELPILLVSSIEFGSMNGKNAYPACIAQRSVNGMIKTTVDGGYGVKSCSDQLGDGSEDLQGDPDVLAILGLL